MKKKNKKEDVSKNKMFYRRRKFLKKKKNETKNNKEGAGLFKLNYGITPERVMETLLEYEVAKNFMAVKAAIPKGLGSVGTLANWPTSRTISKNKELSCTSRKREWLQGAKGPAILKTEKLSKWL